MRTVRDLRDLVNVSRLSFKESDDDEPNYNDMSHSSSSAMSFRFDSTKIISQHDVKIVTNKSKPPLINLSKTTPIIKSVNNMNKLSASRDLLLDRNSIPSVSFSLSSKKPLPPLNSSKQIEKQEEKTIEDQIEPLQMKEKPLINLKPEDSQQQTGNFDDMLTYIDASVVSEWLNRANRSLRKMHKWHQENSSLLTEKSSKSSKLIKYEPFILFANFWLGCHPTAKFDHKQRRQLIEMEHSIICDEVTQAFQVGIDSQQIGIGDIHRLLRAVLKEYPLQFLSFRGVYLILDYIEILCSNRQDDYKKLLSDVKCRTLNKQFAQWLLSIRSFSLINICWSIIKFYRKTFEKEMSLKENVIKGGSALDELDGRLSSLSISNNKETNLSSTSSLSTSSSTSSASSINSSRVKSAKKERLHYDEEFCSISNTIKYDFYLEAVYKNDLPEVLHYLILTKKCDPFKRDEQGRTLVFLAVMNDRPKILNYLIRRWPSIDVNESCSSGNTPLHAAVNKGNLALVDIILQSLNNDNDKNDLIEKTSSMNNTTEMTSAKTSFKLDINKPNERCMNSTALHLAVWNDYNEIALRLVRAKADPFLKMNHASNAFDLALENSNQVLYELLKEYSSSCS